MQQYNCRGVNHVHINVSDLERAIGFYTGIPGSRWQAAGNRTRRGSTSVSILRTRSCGFTILNLTPPPAPRLWITEDHDARARRHLPPNGHVLRGGTPDLGPIWSKPGRALRAVGAAYRRGAHPGKLRRVDQPTGLRSSDHRQPDGESHSRRGMRRRRILMVSMRPDMRWNEPGAKSAASPPFDEGRLTLNTVRMARATLAHAMSAHLNDDPCAFLF